MKKQIVIEAEDDEVVIAIKKPIQDNGKNDVVFVEHCLEGVKNNGWCYRIVKYSDYYQALTRHKEYRCDCGKTGGWTGSFKRPTALSAWSGPESVNNLVAHKGKHDDTKETCWDTDCEACKDKDECDEECYV